MVKRCASQTHDHFFEYADGKYTVQRQADIVRGISDEIFDPPSRPW